jgi:hypothetical protein
LAGWIEQRGWVLPDYGGACFASLPATIERLLTGASSRPALSAELLGGLAGRPDRVVLVYLDAFGWEHAERHAEHPLLARAQRDGVLARLTSQFPSTTTAHVTTIHTGVPVYEHGLYEWRVFEPSLERLISPLPFTFAGIGQPPLPPSLTPATLYPSPTLYERLAGAGVSAAARTPAAIAASPTSLALLRGVSARLAYDDLPAGLAGLASALAALPTPAYGFVYIDRLDVLQHELGIASAAIDDTARALLSTIERDLLARLPSGTLLLVSSDHGMTPTPVPETINLNEGANAEEVIACVRVGADGHPLAPAGSSRDVFLHAKEGCSERLVAALDELLGESAEVRTQSELIEAGVFGPEPSQRLRERLGDVAVLPVYGTSVFWHTPGRFVQALWANHGGLTPQEMEVPLLGLAAG